jgi:hypothetical protein
MRLSLEPSWRLEPAEYRRRMFRRFELTIPLKRAVVITYRNDLSRVVLQLTGLPAVHKADMIYLWTAPKQMVPIPKCFVIDIDRHQD